MVHLARPGQLTEEERLLTWWVLVAGHLVPEKSCIVSGAFYCAHKVDSGSSLQRTMKCLVDVECPT